MISTEELFTHIGFEFHIDHLVKLARELNCPLGERQLKHEANCRFGQIAINTWSKSKSPNKRKIRRGTTQ